MATMESGASLRRERTDDSPAQGSAGLHKGDGSRAAASALVGSVAHFVPTAGGRGCRGKFGAAGRDAAALIGAESEGPAGGGVVARVGEVHSDEGAAHVRAFEARTPKVRVPEC